MNTKEKGYSLSVLVITVAVMLILTMTAVVTLKNLTGDREITNFMSDLQEVEQFVKEYYAQKGVLPIVYENGNAVSVTLPDEALGQVSVEDVGDYYRVDLSKLDSINLTDKDRGYTVNESSLKIYVTRPIKYEGMDYYTLTDELMGINRIYGNSSNFEIVVTGNPITWSTGARLLVSVPNISDVNDRWSFKYYKGGPITAEQFKDVGEFFEYGDSIEVDENGIYSIYVESEEGFAKVINVVVDKIDDIKPYVYTTIDDKVIIGDDETGISKVMYKIVNYEISESIRAEEPETYMQGTLAHLPSAAQNGAWSYEEAYTGEKVEGITPSKGRNINDYKKEYEEYLAMYNEYVALSGETSELDELYPQFQYGGVAYGDGEENIVLYVEDYAGNYSVTDKNGDWVKVSREMLLSSNFIDTIIQPLNGASIIINQGAKYTNDRNITLELRAQGAEKMCITEDENFYPNLPTDWTIFEPLVSEFELSEGDGEKEVYVHFTANQYDDGGTSLITVIVSGEIYLDTTKPTTKEPEVAEVGTNLKLSVKNKQEDRESGIDKIEYGYKASDEDNYKWSTTLTNVKLEPGRIYQVRTRVTDKAGNFSESEIVEVATPVAKARTLPNEPAMATGMQAIVWDGSLESPGDEIEIDSDTWKTENGEEVTWYNYSLGNGVVDSRDSIWANAKTMDGSYWVWIPRYAYKLIYYTDSTKEDIKGYFRNSASNEPGYYDALGKLVEEPDSVKTKYMDVDIIFLYGKEDDKYREEDLNTHEIKTKTLPSEYIVHPAFESREDENVVNNEYGKWKNSLSGIWVSKFEISRKDATMESAGTYPNLQSKPNVIPITNISINDAYIYANEMNNTLWSHLMKNSEWGAVTYLAHSAYGRNGFEISANRNLIYITGGGGTGTSSYSTTESAFLNNYAYDVDASNSKSGMHSSTTGNIYGVYGMAGGADEYVAAYVQNNNSNISSNGEALTQTEKAYLREAYYASENDQPINNYKEIKDVYGNAIYETSSNFVGNNSLAGDLSVYPSGNNTFFVRGGNAQSQKGAGAFAFEASNGEASSSTGFRVVLAFN